MPEIDIGDHSVSAEAGRNGRVRMYAYSCCSCNPRPDGLAFIDAAVVLDFARRLEQLCLRVAADQLTGEAEKSGEYPTRNED